MPRLIDALLNAQRSGDDVGLHIPRAMVAESTPISVFIEWAYRNNLFSDQEFSAYRLLSAAKERLRAIAVDRNPLLEDYL